MNYNKIWEGNYTEDTVKDLLNNTLKEIMSAISAECGSLFLFDSINKELVLNSFYNSRNLHLEGLRLRIGDGISGKVMDIKTPVLVKDINHDLRFRGNGFRHYRTNSFISLPLSTPKGILGLINLADKYSKEAFSEKDFEVTTTISSYVCFAIDIIHNCVNLRQENETLDKQKLLLEKYASVGKLAAGIVHEINNPLDGVIRYTNILISQLEENSIAREYLLEIKKGLNRIANITKSLIEFSHQVNSISSDSSENKKYVDIGGLIDESLDLLGGKLNSDIRIYKRWRGNLPKILDLGISYVAINIIKNAFDAMPCGGTLEIYTEVDDSTLKLIFKDSGLGISAETKEHIFEPFFTTKNKDKGTGLGLAICNEIINKYEGKIEVESCHGQGSSFTVLIPKKYLENV